MIEQHSSDRTSFGGTPLTNALPVGPGASDDPRVALYSEEFAADPHRVYEEMRRRYGDLAPVELAPGIPATLVLGYRTAVRILNDPDHFPADPRHWQKTVPPDHPILPMMAYRPNLLRTDGAQHRRLRTANVDALAGMDLRGLHRTVEELAMPLINSFCAAGEADLVAQYAYPIGFAAVNALLGCPPDLGQRAAEAVTAMFDVGYNAPEGVQTLSETLQDLTRRKRAEPGDDVTSRLVLHQAGFDDEEMGEQLALLYGSGIEPEMNLIVNTLLLMLTDDRFAAGLLSGSSTTRDALEEVLFTNPPIANFCMTFPRQPIMVENDWLPAHQPVVISIAACNNDPLIKSGDITHNRSHLAWSAGPHACPGHAPALVIAQNAIDQLLDALPEMELAIPAQDLVWRPGPFHRSLASLPVKFPKSPPLSC